MITEDPISDQPEKKPTADQTVQAQTENTENSTEAEINLASNENSETDTETNLSEKPAAETSEEPGSGADSSSNESDAVAGENAVDILQDFVNASGSEMPHTAKNQQDDEAQSEISTENGAPQTSMQEPKESAAEPELSSNLTEVLAEMQILLQKEAHAVDFRKFNQLKEQANHLIHQETDAQKQQFVAEENAATDFNFRHPEQAKLSSLLNLAREKHDENARNVEENQSKNLEERQNIIERLKSLYTNTEAGTNLFKAIREVKEAWKNAGQVAKSEFKILNNNYFHHLNQFYQMLDMNKEYMEQEYAHNLERRQHIIERARQLQEEPAVQKALNELQYLHKLWKEEAEPVAEEFREKTWDLFKEISNKIHDRKSELAAQIDGEQTENLEKKNKIIEELKKLSAPEKEPNHSYWQNAIRKIEDLRSEFLKIGSVPRKVSNQNWNEFKLHLKNFNSAKNEFYKGLKGSQQTNLEEKLKLIQTARDNSLSEDWETAVPLFKKLQEDWKKIGHVPRSMTNKVWDDFRDACNTFFNNYREKNNAATDNWKENYKQKKQLLDDLKLISDEDGSIEKIEAIKTAWNNIGKVPREKLGINTEFNKTLREKMKLNKIHDYDLREEGLSENQLTDKARKIKNQIADMEAEIVKMENNLGFFSNPSRQNPLLKETFEKIDDKKLQVENMKQSLHNILTGENQ